MNSALASRLRQRIAEIRSERSRLEYKLLKRRRMLRATFVERFLGRPSKRRKTPAHYLSFTRNGKTIQKYVRQEALSRTMPRARAWGEYYHLLAQWVRLNEKLADVWRELGLAQADEPDADDDG